MVFQAAAGFAQGGGVAVEGEDDVIGQVVDPGQGHHHTLAHRAVTTVGMGELGGQVVGEVMFVLEVVEQLNVAKQEIVDQVVEDFAEFVAHLFSLSWRTGNSCKCSEPNRGLPQADVQCFWAIWIRLPQVSSNTAIVTGPRAVGSFVNLTPALHSRVYSA
ncbi:hypothetical protein IAE37_000183 [Pseudomonas sp. S31]|nr:hypothetical protein [Pseudomonas sp. S31]